MRTTGPSCTAASWSRGEYFDEFRREGRDDGLLIKTSGLLKRGSDERAKKQKGWDFKAHFRFPNVSFIQVTPYYKSLIFQTRWTT